MRNITGPGGFAALKERYERSQRKKRENSEIEGERDSVNNISTEKSSKEKEDLFLKSLDKSIQIKIKEYEEKLSEGEKDINSILRKKIKEDQTDTFIFETKQIIAQKVFEECVKNIDASLKDAYKSFTEETGKVKKTTKSESAEVRLRTKSRSNSEIETTLKSLSEDGFKSWKEENREIVNKKDEYLNELKLIEGFSDRVTQSVEHHYDDVFNNIRKQIQEEEAVTPPISPRGRSANTALKTSEQNNSPFH